MFQNSREKGSQFLAYAAKTKNLMEVRQAYGKVRKLHPISDHIARTFNTTKDFVKLGVKLQYITALNID